MSAPVETIISRRFQLALDIRFVPLPARRGRSEVSVSCCPQVPLADGIKKAHPEIKIGTVGLIFDGKQANDYLEEGKADVIFLGREFMRDPHFVLRAALELGTPVNSASQYHRAWTRLWHARPPCPGFRPREHACNL